MLWTLAIWGSLLSPISRKDMFKDQSRGRILGRNPDKSLRVFLLAIHSPLYICLEVILTFVSFQLILSWSAFNCLKHKQYNIDKTNNNSWLLKCKKEINFGIVRSRRSFITNFKAECGHECKPQKRLTAWPQNYPAWHRNDRMTSVGRGEAGPSACAL
jgi:hypothetical protein